jgi:Flp pilus assembly protein TadG
MNDTLPPAYPYPRPPDHRQASKGQALILVALAFLILLAFVGLTTDVGTLFIYMGHLRRAVDAASLAAAAQYREGRTMAEMAAAADQVMHLNGVDPGTYTITVETCETNPGDVRLCTTPRRKLTRVTSNLEVPMSFLRLVGVNNIQISADSVGEAASLDVVLVIDISESMAWDAAPGNPMRDPHLCNTTDPTGTDGLKGECQPFEEVKRAAINFTNRILNKPAASEEDRVQVVTFGNGWSSDINQGTKYRFYDYSASPPVPRWTSDNGEAQQAINDLQVFDPGTCYDPPDQLPPTSTVHTYYGPCRSYTYTPTAMTYQWFDCLSCWDSGDWSMLPTTNTGGALLKAGNMFTYDTRQEALWIVVLLTDGMANATDREATDNPLQFGTYPIGYCPDAQDSPFPVYPLCQDENVATRHHTGNPQYDADDYARDMADFVGCMPTNPAASCNGEAGQGAIIFAIGLGSGVLDDGHSRGVTEAHGLPYGGSLLRYIAARGYDGDTNGDPCDPYSTDFTQWCGNYYYAPTGPQLSRIFEDIASRIFTRLTH